MIQDILEEEDMELDWDFRLSLINDIVKEQINHPRVLCFNLNPNSHRLLNRYWQ
jgi:hypothetical protein